MLGLYQYSQIKDNYCICYLGHVEAYVIQLARIRPVLSRKFPGLNIYICCRDDFWGKISHLENAFKYSDLVNDKGRFAHIREIRSNGTSNPVEELMAEAGLRYTPE